MNMLVVVLLETCVILLIQLKQINWSVCSIMVLHYEAVLEMQIIDEKYFRHNTDIQPNTSHHAWRLCTTFGRI